MLIFAIKTLLCNSNLQATCTSNIKPVLKFDEVKSETSVRTEITKSSNCGLLYYDAMQFSRWISIYKK
jgi:hypothetical protein